MSDPEIGKRLLLTDDDESLRELFVLAMGLGAIALAGIIVAILFVHERFTPWRDELGKDFDGDRGGAEPADAVRMAPAE